VKEIRSMISQRLQQEKVISPYYKHVDGTSFAAPIVCSIVAQMLEVNPYLMPQDIKEQLVLTAQQLPGFPLERQGYGVVQPTLAVEKAVRSRKEVLIRL
jgi:serine protease AprX